MPIKPKEMFFYNTTNSEKGATMVEVAVSIGVVLFLVVSIMDLLIYTYRTSVYRNILNEGMRRAVTADFVLAPVPCPKTAPILNFADTIHDSLLDPEDTNHDKNKARATCIKQEIILLAQNRNMPITADKIIVRATEVDFASGSAVPVTGDPCTAGGRDRHLHARF